MSEPISREAHEAAARRYLDACQVTAELLRRHRLEKAEAEAALEAALEALTAQEFSPGIPAYLMDFEGSGAIRPRLVVVDDDQDLDTDREDFREEYRGDPDDRDDYDPGPEVDDQGGVSEFPRLGDA